MTNVNSEIWKPIPGYEGYYEASSLGRIKSLDRWINKYVFRHSKILKFQTNHNGYLRCSLSKNGIRKTFFVHRIIANTFLTKKQTQTQINHKNCNKQDNRPKNLEWTSIKQHTKHTIKNKLHNFGTKHYASKLKEKNITDILQLYKNGLSTCQIAHKYQVHRATIYNIIRGKTWKNPQNHLPKIRHQHKTRS